MHLQSDLEHLPLPTPAFWLLAFCLLTYLQILSTFGPHQAPSSRNQAPPGELSTIAPNLRTSSPNLHLTTYPHNTCDIGGTPAENLRTCYLSTIALLIRSPRSRVPVSPFHVSPSRPLHSRPPLSTPLAATRQPPPHPIVLPQTPLLQSHVCIRKDAKGRFAGPAEYASPQTRDAGAGAPDRPASSLALGESC